MKTRIFLCFTLLGCGLLIGVSLAFVWRIHKEQRQYALDRKLIEALNREHSKLSQALNLVEEGANPNTPLKPMHTLSFPRLWNQLRQRPAPTGYHGPNAFLIVCAINGFKSQLMQAMLQHGANVNEKDDYGRTALYWAIMHRQDKGVIKQLLDYGANPNIGRVYGGHTTTMMIAEEYHRADVVALFRKYDKHP